jgi:hypothetical protein
MVHWSTLFEPAVTVSSHLLPPIHIFCLHFILVFLSYLRFVCQVLVPSFISVLIVWHSPCDSVNLKYLKTSNLTIVFSLGHNNVCLDKNDILLLYPHCFALLMDGTCQGMGTCSLKRVNEVTSVNTPVSSHPFTLHWLCYFSVADVRTVI